MPGLTWATAFPYGPAVADRITRGDYINLFAIFDITYPRLKRTMLLGTRWGDENAKLIPAPGDPEFAQYSTTPLDVGSGAATTRTRWRRNRCPRRRDRCRP